MKRLALVLALAVLLPAAAYAARGDCPAAIGADTSSTLVGSWVATVTPDPATGIPPFRELFTFHSDGTLTMIDDNAPAPPFPFTPGHGVWQKSSGNNYVFHYLNLIYDPASYGSNGQTNITVHVKVGDDEGSFSGPGHLKVSDSTGTLLFEADGAIVATRITIDQP